jgi:Ca2+-transporting ATPase
MRDVDRGFEVIETERGPITPRPGLTLEREGGGQETWQLTICNMTQAWAYRTGHAHWQTMVFTVLPLSQMGNVLALRSEGTSFFQLGPWSNLTLLGAVILTFALQMATIYIPALNPIFKTEPLDLDELLLCLALSLVVFVAVEIEKWFIRQGWLRWNSKNAERSSL